VDDRPIISISAVLTEHRAHPRQFQSQCRVDDSRRKRACAVLVQEADFGAIRELRDSRWKETATAVAVKVVRFRLLSATD
jgi:hypothetical protein